MPTAKSRASQGLAPGVPGEIYAKRDNIKVPDADNADPKLDVSTTAAEGGYPACAARLEQDRYLSPNSNATSAVTPYAPDAADYILKGAERTTN